MGDKISMCDTSDQKKSKKSQDYVQSPRVASRQKQTYKFRHHKKEIQATRIDRRKQRIKIKQKKSHRAGRRQM